MVGNIIEFDNVSFTYPGANKAAIKDITFEIRQSEFIVIAGKSGCGKSTLLSHMKKNHIPFGRGEGNMYFIDNANNESGGIPNINSGRIPIEEMSDRDSAQKIGFVGQDIDSQIVSDKVWHELSFGLENLGYKNDVMRRRTAEIAEFMGIREIYRKKTEELSGGEKQLVALASVMAMNPKVLILDEPVNQLSPKAAKSFINALVQINRELSTTIVISEQRLSDVLPYADRVVVMQDGEIVDIKKPEELDVVFDEYRKKKGRELAIYNAIPAASRIYMNAEENFGKMPVNKKQCKMPVSVRQGREWIESLSEHGKLYFTEEHNTSGKQNTSGKKNIAGKQNIAGNKEAGNCVTVRDISFSYAKDRKVIDKLSLNIEAGSFTVIMGGNGSGKTTLLKCISGILKTRSGKIYTDGKVAYLVQNPKALFTELTVEEELAEILTDNKKSDKNMKVNDQIINQVDEMLNLLEIEDCRKMHPYDLSGGQAQRLALGKVLLTQPDILLLDEPTKGLDGEFKEKLAQILKQLQSEGKTIVVITHDMEFAAKHATHCAFMFDGDIVASDEKYTFFCENMFFTTEVSRMTKGILEGCITVEDVQRRLAHGK
ncbi:MAG: ATP-binding cassette domain-containing protein [Lachnospiraceae bacterium]|nr:ATP-binding cassette domain-containing protein [Lachnospiraceae bacterium]